MKYLIALLILTPRLTFAQAPVIVVPANLTGPQQIITPSGTYIVIPNYATGQVMSVIQVSKSSKK
jgi:hypothetical protein